MDDEERRKRQEKYGLGDRGTNGSPDDESSKKYADRLHAEKNSRRAFAYSGFDLYLLEFFDSPWCFCCRRYKGRRDKLYNKATAMMNSELDVLEIIKKLRVNRFTSDCFLTQEQRDLVILHQDYKVSLSDDEDHVKRPDRQVYGDVLNSAINRLRPESVPIDMITYQAIVGEDGNQTGGDQPTGGYYSPGHRDQPVVRTQDNDLSQRLIQPEDNR